MCRSVCSHAGPEVVMALGLHGCRHTHDEDPEVPLVSVTSTLLLFPLRSVDLTSPLCHIQTGQLRNRQRTTPSKTDLSSVSV